MNERERWAEKRGEGEGRKGEGKMGEDIDGSSGVEGIVWCDWLQ
jgi:hypothetical protein